MSDVTEGAKLYSGAIVSFAGGKAAPQEFVDAVVAKNTACIGIAIQIPENKEVLPARDNKSSAAYFAGSRNHYPKAPMCFFLGSANNGATFQKEDIQPFDLVTEGKNSDGADKPTICVMVDGDFPKYIKDNGHSEHYNFAHEYLKPKVAKLNKLVSGDLDKVAAGLKDMEDDITALDVPTCMILFILGNGQTVRLLKNYETFKETSFGFTSDTYGWTEQNAPVTAKSSEPASLLDKLRGSVPPPAVASVPAVKANPLPPPRTDTAIKPQGRAYTLRSCPKDIDKKNAIGAWYATWTLDGSTPAKHWQRPEVRCKIPEGWKGPVYWEVDGKETKFQSFGAYAAAALPKADSTPAPVTPPPADAPAETAPETPEDDAQTDDGDASDGGEEYEFPLISDDERKILDPKITQFVDENGNFVQDPKSLNSWLERRETFREAMEMEKMDKPPEFTPEFSEDMLTTVPYAFFTWGWDWVTYAKNLEARVAELETRLAASTQPAAASSSNPLPPPRQRGPRQNAA